MGDLNADLMEPLISPGRNLLEFLALVNASVVDVFSTRVTDHSASGLDIIAMDRFIECIYYAPEDNAATDHFPVTAKINVVCNSSLKPVLKRNFKHVSEDAFQQDQ